MAVRDGREKNDVFQRGNFLFLDLTSMLRGLPPALLACATAASLSIGAVTLAERFVSPRPRHPAGGLVIRSCLTLAALGFMSVVTGSFAVASFGSVVLGAALVLISNQKRRVLGEPLMFSDAWLLGAVLRYPRFYLSTIPRGAAWSLAIAVPLILVLLWVLLGRLPPRPGARLLGGGLALAGIGALLGPVRRHSGRIVSRPALDDDMRRHGLFACLVLYGWAWGRDSRGVWRGERATVAAPAGDFASSAAPLVVVVQCESFADPAELLPGGPLLPALVVARRQAVLHGRLQVSGFGAYTMRTEYGVLTGEDEEALGFRRYDPYLDALRAAPAALPERLSAWGFASSFVHPHDLRFYNRHRLMPRFGFGTCIGPEAILPNSARQGPYIGDLALAQDLERRIAAAEGPTLLYAVTIENHGPWQAKRIDGAADTLGAYLGHLANSDRMLERLMAALERRQGPAVLVFFGDHRPSIPGHVVPGGERHTPYVVLRFGLPQDAGGTVRDLTPAGLHRIILDEAAAMLRTPKRHAA